MQGDFKDYKKEFRRWLDEVREEDVLEEIKKIDEASVEDAFYKNLSFGTGGLRGIVGAGTNRMNIYVVRKASQGVSMYLLKEYHSPLVVIGYDTRIQSDVFAKAASEVFAANGIRVHLWPEVNPVGTVSFAVRELKASAGVMITASHNPAQYNGYKVYGSDGCQITNEVASEIQNEIEKIDIFNEVKFIDFDRCIKSGMIEFIKESVLNNFINAVKLQSVLFGDKIDRDVSIVYSPLNGTGLKPITRVLQECGFSNITFVAEQKNPDGHFPTCPYPNPELREAMELGLSYCRKINADLLLVTDPDADRCGIAVKNGDDYQILSGNEVGILLLDYICAQRQKHNRMPTHPVFIKTIVTIDLAEKIAEHYGVQTTNVLTGFKYIGEQIGLLEKEGREKDYICGVEESCGYLTGSYVRDKDAVSAALMICEMAALYKKRGVSIIKKLKEIYSVYGYCLNTLHSYDFPGSSGLSKMQNIMTDFRKGIKEIEGIKIVRADDYSVGINGLPKANVLKFYTDVGSLVIRPSGTEPKLKIYISVTAADKREAESIEKKVASALAEMMK